MTFLKRCLWATAAAAVCAGGASAQVGGTGGTTGAAAGGLSGNSNLNSNAALSTNAQQSITSTSGGFGQSVIQSSNIIAPFFANPSFQGVPAAGSSGVTVVAPGGFGTALFGGTGTAAAGTGGRATTTNRAGGAGTTAGAARTATSLGGTTGLGGIGGTTTGLGGTGRTTGLGSTTGLGGTAGIGGAAGRTGGTAGTTGVGGLGGQNNGLTVNRNVAYTQELKFGAAPVPSPQLQADVQAALSSSSSLGGARVAATVDGSAVTLRGTVADEDEARLVEGMVRLTPGVKDVKNELDFPGKPKTP